MGEDLLSADFADWRRFWGGLSAAERQAVRRVGEDFLSADCRRFCRQFWPLCGQDADGFFDEGIFYPQIAQIYADFGEACPPLRGRQAGDFSIRRCRRLTQILSAVLAAKRQEGRRFLIGRCVFDERLARSIRTENCRGAPCGRPFPAERQRVERLDERHNSQKVASVRRATGLGSPHHHPRRPRVRSGAG